LLKRADLTSQIVGAAIEVHRTLGPGLLESVYEECLCFELQERRLRSTASWKSHFATKGANLSSKLRIDVLVESAIVVALKSIGAILPIHEAQQLTYLRLMNCDIGLFINFNVPMLKQGIVRRVL
jgi:GxxExxY protein